MDIELSVFIVAIKSAVYYKDDERVPTRSQTYLFFSRAVLLIPVVLHTSLATVPGLGHDSFKERVKSSVLSEG